MVFSHNLKNLACLISGGHNGILVFETGHSKPKVEKYFDIKQLNSIKPPAQEFTQVSFYPINEAQLCGSGPHNDLSLFLIVQPQVNVNDTSTQQAAAIVRSDLRRNSNPLLNTNAKVNITHHVWQEDGDYIVACTKEGHIVVKSNPAMRDTAQDLHFPKEHFISVQLHQHGMVAATHDSAFYIFSVDKTKKVHKF